ncbi:MULTISPECIES: phosphatase PAP2 family protein [Stenotrophomonas]|jgi:undecaprenyl-diphosphatase|uniref:phosphatase PAP2 family protein n=1 Tax=Stenotrophomonas TaxID=40323 RepID=UPI000702BC5A|nr:MULTISPECIES: phosphatase PAP2 family protein [Stenotrophomonas]KRG85049.1 phosphoesterase [Stenotrophomonas acidaminiphila]MCA7024418.1 phosphatase PAP2 family protein [Stenotrophomonas acidaminiphila]MCE4076288.1 phosphatase PAP2 family protein [Stenotrophomonas acidaminiphila]QOF99337.1 phosphatase PAP2 family protein [Stenotrophomonas sp. CW117]WHL19659.1 phosphatase PAP2 family protein [Stenotrophomonas acidaminiphila]
MPLLPPDGLLARETRWCRRANHYCRRRRIRTLFAVISRLGDGVFWYLLMAALVLVDGMDGLRASAHMAATGVVALTLYKVLKRWTRRPRPFAADLRIRAWVAPLDEYSFPSGHTLHAVSFSVVALAYYPWLAPVLLPFTAGVALSRVVLGLHYPSDVLAATGIALLLGSASLQLMPLPF